MLLKKLVVDKILILEPTSSFFVIEISFTMSQSTGIPVPIRRVQVSYYLNHKKLAYFNKNYHA